MRRLVAALPIVLALGLAACGSTEAPATAAAAEAPPLVKGTLVARNGAADNLGGVFVQCPETGAIAVTQPDGTFQLDAPEGAGFHLDFDDPFSIELEPALDCREADDPTREGDDLAGGDVALGALAAGESLTVEVVLEAGVVVECRVTREREAGPFRHEGEGLLVPVDGFDALYAIGEVEVHADARCAWLEVEVRGDFGDRATLTVVLVAPDGTRERVGTLELRRDGEGHLGVESCDGAPPLPFGVAEVGSLAGYGVLVEGADGRALLAGTVPTVGTRPDGEHAPTR